MRAVRWAVGLWISSHVLLVLASVAEVALYSVAIAPGLAQEAYEAHARVSAPWVSILAGGPLFFAWGRMLRARLAAPADRRVALAVWGLYSLTDFAIVTASGAWAWPLTPLWIVSQTVKGVGIGLGVRRPGPGSDHQG